MAASAGLTRQDMMMLVARLTCVAAIGFFSVRWLISQLDPTRSTKQRAKKKVRDRLYRLYRPLEEISSCIQSANKILILTNCLQYICN